MYNDKPTYSSISVLRVASNFLFCYVKIYRSQVGDLLRFVFLDRSEFSSDFTEN